MSMLIIWASPNQDGLTAKCKQAAVDGILEYGMECSEVHLNRLNIGRCQVCGNGFGLCSTQGTCVMDDDFNRLYALMKRSDAIVLVTPVYWHDMAEPMKALLDRVRRCATKAERGMEGKKILLVACAGGTGNGVVECLQSIEIVMKHMHANVRDRLPVTRFSADYMPRAIRSAAWHLCYELTEDRKGQEEDHG